MQLFAAITKVDAVTRTVYGRAVQETVDKADEIFDYESSVPLFRSWSANFDKATGGKSLGNIRAMHGKVAAGKIVGIEYNDADKAIDIAAKIVDDGEWEKCVEGVYTGFSIGGRYVKRWDDTSMVGKKRYTAEPSEISIVDLPCVPSAMFTMVKLDGGEEQRKFTGAIRKGLLAQGWTCAVKTHSHTTKAEAERCIVSVEKQLLDGVVPGDVREEFAKALGVDLSRMRTLPSPEAVPSPSARVARTLIETADGLEKGLWTVGSFARILSDLVSTHCDVKWEADSEADGSMLPTRIQQLVQMAGEILVDMAREEVGEALATLKADGTSVTKHGAEYYEGIAERVAGLLKKAPPSKAASEGEATMNAEELKKHVDAEVEKSTKVAMEKITEQAGEIAKLSGELAITKAELDGFKKQLADPKGSVKAVPVEKTDDVTVTGKEPALDVSKASALDMIRHAQRSPQPFVPQRAS